MKIAILSDVHGNYPALLKVLDDAGQRGVEHYIFAGDYCLSGAWPDDCIKAIKGVPDKIIIRGNEERYLENLIGKDQVTWTDGQMQISYWCYRNLQSEHLKYLISLPQITEIEINGVKIRVAHSSDTFLGKYEFSHFGPEILAKKYADTSVTSETLKHDICTILDNDPVFLKKVHVLEDGIYIFGHSHVQWSYKCDDRNIMLINPGSCGLPLDAIEDSIPYTLLTISKEGMFEIEEIRLPFSKREYAEQLKQTSQYTEAGVWSKVIISELLTAREHLTFFLQFAEKYANDIGDAQRPFSVETWEAAYAEWKKL